MILNPNIGEIVEIGGDLYMVFENISIMDPCKKCDLKYDQRKCTQVFCGNVKSLESKRREYKFIDIIIC